MLWKLCACGAGGCHRVHREWWMRWFFPERRLYRCAGCGQRVFVPAWEADPEEDAATPLQARLRRARGLLAHLVRFSLVAGLAGLAGAAWWAGPASHSSGSVAASPVSGSARACRKIHVFREGETLESIARDELGAAWRWQDIAAANPGLIDRQILSDQGFQPGMQLQLPLDCNGG